MKTGSAIVLAMGLLGALALGCASTKQTEKLLLAAGFKTMPATTPEQQAHIQTLPKHKVTMVVRGGKTYFVYPDPKQKEIYLGTQAQYDEYQKLRFQQQMAEEQAATANSEASWAPWGPWGGVDFVEPAPAFRR